MFGHVTLDEYGLRLPYSIASIAHYRMLGLIACPLLEVDACRVMTRRVLVGLYYSTKIVRFYPGEWDLK